MKFVMSRLQILEKLAELVTAEARITALIAELHKQGGAQEDMITKMLTRAGASSTQIDGFLAKYRTA
jgi:mannitol/fructose-specific phosphotransferase system IIA component